VNVLLSEDAQKKASATHTKIASASVGRFTDLDGKVFLWIDNMHRATGPSTFIHHFESKRNC